MGLRLRFAVSASRRSARAAAKSASGRPEDMAHIERMGDGDAAPHRFAGRNSRKSSSLLRRLLGSKTEPHASPSARAAMGHARRAIALCHALMSERGEVSGARLAREALAAYLEEKKRA